MASRQSSCRRRVEAILDGLVEACEGVESVIVPRWNPFWIICERRPENATFSEGRIYYRFTRPLTNEPQAAFDLMGRAMTKIRGIDTSAWTKEDNTIFRDSLASLKAKIDHYLNPPSNPD